VTADQIGEGSPVRPLIDYVVGKPSETARHLIARQAFLGAFLADDRVTQFLESWADRSDLTQLRTHVHIAVNQEKAEHWSGDVYPMRGDVDLWNVPGLLDWLPSPETGRDETGGGPFERALQTVGDRSGESVSEAVEESAWPWPDFVSDAECFVIGLNLPYPWLVLALLLEFLGRFVVLDEIDLAGPVTYTNFGAVRWNWPSQEGASRPRLAADDGIGPMPASIRETVERRAIWLYRSTARGESHRFIARAEFGDEWGDRRKDVRTGIAAVRRLFRLTRR